MTWVAPRPLKFQQWYPNLEAVCQYASAITCNATLQAYLGSEEERRQLGPVESYCDTHINCMLSNMPEKVKSNMAASAVVLGLIPSILASLGPSVAEISLLSLQRPLLAFLLSLGSPVIYSSRYGTYDNPFDTLEVITGALVVPRIENYAGVISAVQYIFAFGAVANTLLVSYQIGARGILSWACSVSYLPLYWSFTTVIIHVTAVCALHITIHNRTGTASSPTNLEPATLTKLASIVRQEFQLCANRDDKGMFQDIQPGPIGVTLNILAGCFGLFHVIFGTVIFPAYLFIGLTDSTAIFFLYLASSLVCRMILYFELGGLRKVREIQGYMKVQGGNEVRVYRWIAQNSSASS